MTTKTDQHARRLGEAKILAGMLADRMMAAYVLGGHPTQDQVQALCGAVLLLEAHAVPLPAFVEDVITRLQTQDEAGEPAPAPAAKRRDAPGVFGRVLRPLRARSAAWASPTG